MKSLKQMQDEVYEVNQANGWLDQGRVFGEDIALLHSEASEALEAYREGLMETVMIDGKPEGVPSELADILIRLLDTCHRRNIDLEAEYERKIAFNRSRGYRHGGKLL